jgi:hypothetical protein
MQERGPNEEANQEFHQVRPSGQPLEWRRLLVKDAEQTADDANDQTREQRSPEVLDIQLYTPPGREFEHRSVDHPNEKTKSNQRDWEGKNLDDRTEHSVDETEEQSHPEIGARTSVDGNAWDYRSCGPNG